MKRHRHASSAPSSEARGAARTIAVRNGCPTHAIVAPQRGQPRRPARLPHRRNCAAPRKTPGSAHGGSGRRAATCGAHRVKIRARSVRTVPECAPSAGRCGRGRRRAVTRARNGLSLRCSRAPASRVLALLDELGDLLPLAVRSGYPTGPATSPGLVRPGPASVPGLALARPPERGDRACRPSAVHPASCGGSWRFHAWLYGNPLLRLLAAVLNRDCWLASSFRAATSFLPMGPDARHARWRRAFHAWVEMVAAGILGGMIRPGLGGGGRGIRRGRSSPGERTGGKRNGQAGNDGTNGESGQREVSCGVRVRDHCHGVPITRRFRARAQSVSVDCGQPAQEFNMFNASAASSILVPRGQVFLPVRRGTGGQRSRTRSISSW